MPAEMELVKELAKSDSVWSDMLMHFFLASLLIDRIIFLVKKFRKGESGEEVVLIKRIADVLDKIDSRQEANYKEQHDQLMKLSFEQRDLQSRIKGVREDTAVIRSKIRSVAC